MVVEIKTYLHGPSQWTIQDQPPVVWYDVIHPLNLHRINILTTPPTACLHTLEVLRMHSGSRESGDRLRMWRGGQGPWEPS